MQLFTRVFSILCVALPLAACGDDGGTTARDTASDAAGDTSAPDGEDGDSASPDGRDDASADADDGDGGDTAEPSDTSTPDTVADADATDATDGADSDVAEVDPDATDANDTDDAAGDGDDAAADSEDTAAPTPRLSLAGPDGPLTDGATPDAGEQTVGEPFTRVYTITNDGDGPLAVTGVTLAKGAPENCEQALSAAPDEVVQPGDSTGFAIDATVLDEGPANCPFVVLTDDPDHGALAVDVAATGVLPEPTVKKSATATCGSSSGFGFLVAVLADYTPDGSLVTTDTFIDNCSLTTQVGTLPGGTTVNEGADTASCGALSCSESNNECRGLGGSPAGAGTAVTISMTDPLLGGTVSHAFPKAPGTLTRSSIGASVSRGAPLTITTSGGVAGTLTLVTINQANDDGQTTLICEFPAESSSVSIPTSLLAYFHDGAFNLLVDTRVQSFAVANGYNVGLVYANSTLPQQSSFVP